MTVLLLEAGGYDLERDSVNEPGQLPLNYMTDMDWGYKTVPQKHAFWSFKEKVSISPYVDISNSKSYIDCQTYCSDLVDKAPASHLGGRRFELPLRLVCW